MKVDMSPEAVTRRLKLMDELWVLSMKLMNAGKKLRDKDRSTAPRKATPKGTNAA